jgi:hypothetical protein
VHDDVSYHSHVVYQQPPRDADADGIMAALSEGLTPYDVQTANPWPVLSAYFNGRVPRYDDLKRDPRFDPFIRSLAQRSTPFFMGGTFSVAHGLTDPASGQVTCSGTLMPWPFASADGRQIGKAQARAEAMGKARILLGQSFWPPGAAGQRHDGQANPGFLASACPRECGHRRRHAHHLQCHAAWLVARHGRAGRSDGRHYHLARRGKHRLRQPDWHRTARQCGLCRRPAAAIRAGWQAA